MLLPYAAPNFDTNITVNYDANAFTLTQNGGDLVFNVNSLDTYNGVSGVRTKGAPTVTIGTLTDAEDNTLVIAADIEGDALFRRAVSDVSTFKGINGSAYTSYDAQPTYRDSGDATPYNHGYGYEWRPTFDGANGISAYAGFVGTPNIGAAAAAVGYVTHFWARQGNFNGVVPTFQAALWIDHLSGAAANYGIYQQDFSNPNYFAGPIQADGGVGAKSLTANDTLVAYPTGGGLALVGKHGAGALPAILAYSDSFGTPGNLIIQSDGAGTTTVGGDQPISGDTFQVIGTMLGSSDIQSGHSIQAYGAPAAFNAGGGVLIRGDNAGQEIKAYSDNIGTPANLRVNYAGGLTLHGGGIGVGNSANATALGSVVKKMQVYDKDGNSLGFVPIYDSIT